MTDKEKIKNEIERLNHLVPYDRKDRHDDGLHDAYFKMLQFIDDLPEPVGKDLEIFANKESEAFAEREYEIDSIDRNALRKGYYWGVKDGANWQKEQMINKACKWLLNNRRNYSTNALGAECMCNDFREAMESEK